MVDDDVDAADTFAELLVSLGHEAKVAYEGAAGLAIDRSWDPHVVFVDLGLPTIDGYEVARQLRARRPEDVRIVALSGYGQAEDQERSRLAGCDGHLMKPAALADILRALARG